MCSVEGKTNGDKQMTTQEQQALYVTLQNLAKLLSNITPDSRTENDSCIVKEWKVRPELTITSVGHKQTGSVEFSIICHEGE